MSTHEVTQAPAAAPITAASAAQQVFATLTNALNATVLNILGTKRLEAKKFIVRASGTCTTVGATTTASPFIAVGTSLTVASDSIIAQPAGVTVNSTSCPWLLELELIFDSTSGKLNGSFKSCINNTPVAAQALSTVVTGLNSTPEPPFSLVAGFQFSAAAAGNIATLAEFVLDA